MDVLHTAIWVIDVDAMLTFYCDGLGLEKRREYESGDVTNYFLGGESDAEIQFRFDGAERAVEPSGIDHLAVSVTDIDETIETLVEDHGSEILSEPEAIDELNICIAFVTDPEGYAVELIERLDDR